MRPTSPRLSPLSIAIAALACAASLAAYANDTAPITVTASFTSKVVAVTDELEIELSRAATLQDGKIAICIGPLDLSAQTIKVSDTKHRAELKGLKLPVGKHDVVVHLIRGNEWLDVARIPIEVSETGSASTDTAADKAERKSDASSDSTTASEGEKPSVAKFTLGTKGTLYERVTGATKAGTRGRFQDVSGTSAVSWEGGVLGLPSKVNANFNAVSFRQEAPRFAVDGIGADKFDLNDYKLEFGNERAQLSIGHVTYGNHLLLLNQLATRGVMGTFSVTPWLDVSATAMRATSIVGFDDLLGLQTEDHRILGLTAGIEWFAEQKGLLRTELLFMNGRALPQVRAAGGQVPDAESNRAVGLRLLSNDKDGRWKVDGLWARSRFGNPPSAELSQGSVLVPVREETRDAYQLDASYSLVKDAHWLSEKWPISVRSIAHYIYSEPLFKTLGASFVADQRLVRVGAEAKVGEIGVNVNGSRKNDNVTTIPTILKTGTYGRVIALTVPLPTLIGTSKKPATLWPALQAETQRIRQYTLRIPDGTNARSSFWPDQLNYTHKLSLAWSVAPYTVNYNFEIGDQDNRQPERERADFLIHTHAVTVGWQASERTLVNLGLNRSRNFSYEKGQTTYNNGGTASIDTQLGELWTLRAFDSLLEQYSNTLNLSLQATRKLSLSLLGQKIGGQVFVRAALANNRALDSGVKQILSGKQRLIQLGGSINF
jgi:hypothetical protein